MVNGLESDIEETERAIFSGREDLTERIYELKQEITDFYRTVHPLLPRWTRSNAASSHPSTEACFATSATCTTTFGGSTRSCSASGTS